MTREETKQAIDGFVKDPRLLRLRLSTCDTVVAAIGSVSIYLHVPAAFSNDMRIRGLSVVVDICVDVLSSTILLYKNGRWYSGAALVRQLMETEYLLSLFAIDRETAATWLTAPQAELRKWWTPSAVRKILGISDHEYWSHCEMGGHPLPSAASLLDGQLVRMDRRLYWIDLAEHATRIFNAVTKCLHTFEMTTPLEEVPWNQGLATVKEWLSNDPAREFLSRLPENPEDLD